MGLTQKILLFTSLIVIALVATTLVFTTIQADRLAHTTINQALEDTKGVWETFQADRYNKLKLGVRVLGNDPAFKAAVSNFLDSKPEERTDALATVYDLLQERGKDLGADFFVATDPAGVVIARSDRAGAQGLDLSKDPLVRKPLEGEEAATVWPQGDKLYHAVSVPMQTTGTLVGVLIAGYGIDEALANNIRKLTHSEIAYLTRQGGQTQLSVSSLGTREDALKDALGRPGFAPASVDLRGDQYIGVEVPLKAATGEVVGAVLALRSLAVEMASFARFRNSLILVSLIVMAMALGLAFVAASRITGPVRRLVSLVERARDGSYSGAVSVATTDEIGALARSFNSLLADLREKEQMIGFLREGMTLLKKKAPTGATPTPTPGTTTSGTESTTSLSAVTETSGAKVEKGQLFGGRYEILGTLGKGGMGVVYRAQDRKLDEVVALKVLRPEVLQDDPTILERFKQEIKLARKITHRNVLRTHDFGDAEGTPYISMEYLEGVTLKDLVRNKGALPSGVGLRIAKQMCQGLEAAHRQGVVHRDIKPQNMLILPETGELKIMDFGIARISEVHGDGGLTSAGTVMGTPDYMPPEQAQGQPADFRSDIYSLGVVLFEVFSGKLPFSADTVMGVVLKHIQEPPPRARSLNRAIPADLDVLIARCLDKDPAKRFQQVGEILKGLTAVSSRLEPGSAA